MEFNQIKNTGAQFLRFFRSLPNNSLLLSVLLLSLIFGASCDGDASERAENVGGVTVRQVIENPNTYVGKTVTVSGDVEEIWRPRAFNMDSGVSTGELLVIGREPFPQVPFNNQNTAYMISDIATVTGTVRMLVEGEIEREIGWDLTPEIVAEYNAKPVLIAQTVSFKPGAKRSTASVDNMNVNQTANNTNNNAMIDVSGERTDSEGRITNTGIYASTTDKNSLAGKKARFSEAKVVRVVGPRTFTIASGNEEIYVMLDEESARGVGTQGKIAKGSTLTVSGEFERLQPAEISDIKNNRFRPLTDQEREFLKNTSVYFQANEISSVN